MGMHRGSSSLNVIASLAMALLIASANVHPSHAASKEETTRKTAEEKRLERKKAKVKKDAELAERKKKLAIDHARVLADKIERQKARSALNKESRSKRLGSYSDAVQNDSAARKKKIADEQLQRENRIAAMKKEREALAAKVQAGTASKAENIRHNRLGRRVALKEAAHNAEANGENRRMTRKDNRDLNKIQNFEKRLAAKNSREQAKMEKAQRLAEARAEAARVEHENAILRADRARVQLDQRQLALTQQKVTQNALNAELAKSKADNRANQKKIAADATKAEMDRERAANLAAANASAVDLDSTNKKRTSKKQSKESAPSVGASVMNTAQKPAADGGFAKNSVAVAGTPAKDAPPVVAQKSGSTPLVADGASLGHGTKAIEVAQAPIKPQIIVVQAPAATSAPAAPVSPMQWNQNQQLAQQQHQQQLQQQQIQMLQQQMPVAAQPQITTNAPVSVPKIATATYSSTNVVASAPVVEPVATVKKVVSYTTAALDPPVTKDEKELVKEKDVTKEKDPKDLKEKKEASVPVEPSNEGSEIRNAEATQHAAKFCKGRADYVACVETEKRAYLGLSASATTATESGGI